MANRSRILTTSVLNPRYDPRVKRGILSIRRFYAGLPITVRSREPSAVASIGYVTPAALCIDIPALGVMTVTDDALVQALLAASQDTPAPAASPVQMQAPAGEIFMKCGRCQGTVWLNTLTSADGGLARAICARCRNQVPFLLFRPAGSA